MNFAKIFKSTFFKKHLRALACDFHYIAKHFSGALSLVTIKPTQPTIKCSELLLATLEQGVKYVQS